MASVSPPWRARFSAARHGPHSRAPGNVACLQIRHLIARVGG
jgi:hypothetical protein